MIKKYLKMKVAEIKVKTAFYEKIATIMDNQKEITNAIELVKKLYMELKDVPMEELRNEFIEKLAELVHKDAEKKRETEK